MENNEDYLLTLFEACEILGKSSRTITRYVHKHVLHPRGVKSRQGTLEYRFSKSEVEALKQREDSLKQYDYFGRNQLSGQQVPLANFANLQYPPQVKQPAQFLIPGISYPVANPISQPTNAPVENKNYQAPDRGYADDLSHISGLNEIERIRNQDNASTMHQAWPQSSASAKYNPDFQNPPDPADMVAAKKDKEESSSPVAMPAALNHNNEEIITLLKETTGMLRDQLKVKDDQIKNLDDKIGQLIERNRETNILLKGLQDKVGLLEKPKNENENEGRNQRVERSQASQPVQAQEESQCPVPSPREGKAAESVKVKISSNSAGTNQTDTVARGLANAGNYSYTDEDEGRAGVGIKKGLFGKIFGQQ